MRFRVWLWVVAIGVAPVGCTTFRRTTAVSSAGDAAPASLVAPASTNAAAKLIVTPDETLIGRVVMVNPQARFVALNFQIGRMPALEQRLNVYRRGLKVGEVKVSGPQRDDNIMADVFAGEAQVGDEVRDW